MAAINRSIEVCQVMERGNNSNRSMEVVQVIENRNRYVTKEEFENLASRIEKNEEKRMFEKKVEEKKMLERFNVLNDRIMFVDTKDFKTNLRIKNFERHMKSLDTRCKELNDRFESVRPVTSYKTQNELEEYDLVPLTVEQINRMAHNSSCVEFIELLVLAAFPDRYFEDHSFADMTNVQFIGLFQIIGRYFETAILSGKPLKLSLPCDHEAKREVATIMEKQINFWKRENGYSRSEEPVIPNAQQQDRSGNDREVDVIQLSERELDALAFKADSVGFIGKVTLAAFPENYFLKTENTSKSLSPRQLDSIYEMVIKKISQVKRRGKPSVPISKEAVFPVIYQKISNFRASYR
ncbi:uncharacterized protein LOC124316399 [Daphnia pulicaria]|uniref:uncharacterized protein LOC124316399 n=1 Tax=Daphnia pulicaria TaxID=35523 RepID=UPI001EEA8CD0|nr:uncharacterized protein LOC124316399 [Daphnia pulicaria]